MAGTLTMAVLAGGSVWAPGTARGDEGADVIPDGPWWDDFDVDAEPAEPEGKQQPPVVDPEDDDPEDDDTDGDERDPDVPDDPDIPDISWTVERLREHAEATGVDLDGATRKADILTRLQQD